MANCQPHTSELDVQLDTFIRTLYSCESAMYVDNTAVPISTIVQNLGFIQHEAVNVDLPTVEETCQKILEGIRLGIS